MNKRIVNLDDLLEYWKNAIQCSWTCIFCGKQCGGIEGHSGNHQCDIHSNEKVSMWCK